MNNVTSEVKRGNPNELAKAEIADMPSLAGQPPRTMFHLDLVVLSDLKGRGFSRPSQEPIVMDLLVKQKQEAI